MANIFIHFDPAQVSDAIPDFYLGDIWLLGGR